MKKREHSASKTKLDLHFNDSSLEACSLCQEPINERDDPEPQYHKSLVMVLQGEPSTLKGRVILNGRVHVRCLAGQMPVGILEEFLVEYKQLVSQKWLRGILIEPEKEV
jgi:hypothetical protein